ncbi:hypothetical protein [Paucibacter soli]|uniref:hypothetical protein n=1 Tax=Paucibacter soli TaxID=3133433 RepID=UPI0030B4F7F8
MTALDKWGSRGKSEVENGPGNEVLETELRGSRTDHRAQDQNDSILPEPEGDEGILAEDAAAAQEQAATRALKQKQGMRVIYGAVGFGGLVIAGLIAMKVLRPAQIQADQLAQTSPQGQTDQAQVIAQVGPQPSMQAKPIIDGASIAAPASAPAALDFGLQAPAPQSSAPALTRVEPASKSNQQEAVNLHAQPQAQLPVTQPPAKPSQDVASAELDKVRFELSALKSSLAERSREYDALRGELASLRDKVALRPQAPVTPKQVTPKVEASKPAPAKVEVKVAAEKAAEPTALAAPVTQAPALAKSKVKVRSDYAIYAFVDQRFWIKGADGEPFAIGSDSPLPDGTRVTGLDKDKAIVYTSTGEIR